MCFFSSLPKCYFIKTLLLSLFFTLFCFVAESYAQSGSISGIVIENAGNKPIQYATVSILNFSDSSLVTGIITSQDGSFLIDNLSKGEYLLKVSFVGFKSYFFPTKITLNPGENFQTGQISISITNLELGETIIEGDRLEYETRFDKRIFNLSGNIAAGSGSVLNVLENIPSITIDMDGNISLRGNESVIILIDDRPTGLSGEDLQALLDQLPAESVESIEVITNPSARYEAEGVAGIINIKMKGDNVRRGLNGSANASIGTGQKYNSSLNLNYGNQKFNGFVNYSYRNEKYWREGYTNRFYLDGENIIANMNQIYLANDHNKSHLLRGGLSYRPGSASLFNLDASLSTRNRERTDTNFYDFPLEGSLESSLDRSQTFRMDERMNSEVALSYQNNFNDKKRDLRLNLSHNFNIRDDEREFTEKHKRADTSGALPEKIFESALTNTEMKLSVFQADYEHKLNDTTKFEAGYRGHLSYRENDFIFSDFDMDFEEYILNHDKSNHFIYNEQIHALYGIFASGFGKFTYQAGLRAEKSLIYTEQKATDETSGQNYMDLFPSVYFNYSLPKRREIHLNYSRRISRPRMWNLNPFINYSNPLSLRAGNPDLEPEYTNSYEIGYTTSFKSVFLQPSIYYRKTNGVIQRITTLTDENATLMTFQNLAQRENYGFELMARSAITKWWSTMGSVNIFRSVIDGSNVDERFHSDRIGWSGQMSNNFVISSSFRAQAIVFYRSPMSFAQGEMKEIVSLNVGARKDLLDDKLSISLNISDVLNSREFVFSSTGEGYFQDFSRKRESRIATISASYRFGGYSERNDRRERRPTDSEMEDDMF